MDLQSIIDADWELLSSFNGSDSVFLDGFISTLTWGWTWLPLYIGWLYLVIKNNELPKVIAIISAVACCLLLTAVVDGMIVKPLVARPRPLNDPVFGHLVDTVHGIHSSDYSFFSAHSANTMGQALFFSLLVRNSLFSCAMMSWTLLNGYTRLYLGMHFPSDVLAGFTWGAIVAVSVYTIYYIIERKLAPKGNYISTQYTKTGFSLVDIDIVLCLYVACFIFALIKALFI